jgi:hypothetical protein
MTTKSCAAALLAAVLLAAPAAASDESASLQGPSPTRGAALPSLYVSLAALNVYDGVTTLRGVGRGAAEANGLMAPLATRPAAFWAVKGAVTTSSIVIAEKMWRAGFRKRAIVFLAVSNGIMTAVAARNAAVTRRLP